MADPAKAPRVTTPQEFLDMDSAIWEELPFETVAHVLSFLLVPDVCRYRSVSKKWNELILSEKFAAHHGRNARRRRDPSFIALHTRRRSLDSRVEDDHEVWCCLDLDARRWYTFDEEDRHGGAEISGVQAIDGGLVCRLQYLQPQPFRELHTVIVHNVNGLTRETLPDIARHKSTPNDPKLLMVVDEAMSFKVILLNHNFNASAEILDDPLLQAEDRLKIQYDPLMYVYESGTKGWKSVVNKSWIEHGAYGYIRSIVMYQGSLYVLFHGYGSGEDDVIWRLERYNLAGEVWENVDVCTYGFISCSLVVSRNSLYLVIWLREECTFDPVEYWFFEVREIRTVDMTQETMFKLSAAAVMAWFDIREDFPIRIRTAKSQFNLLGICVVGFEKSLFLVSESSGKSVLFDLVTRSWDHTLPPNPLGQAHNPHKRKCPWVGKHMNLLLPWNTDW